MAATLSAQASVQPILARPSITLMTLSRSSMIGRTSLMCYVHAGLGEDIDTSIQSLELYPFHTS